MRSFDKKYENELGKSIGSFIAKRRKELGMKQYDVYNGIDVDRITLYNYEKNRTKMPLSKLLELCSLLEFGVKISIDKNGINLLLEREEDNMMIKNGSGEIDEKKVGNDVN